MPSLMRAELAIPSGSLRVTLDNKPGHEVVALVDDFGHQSYLGWVEILAFGAQLVAMAETMRAMERDRRG